MHNCVTFSYVRKELVAKAFAVRSTLYKAGNVDEFNYRGGNFFAVVKGCQLVKSFVGNGNYANVGFDRAEGIVRRLCAGMGYCIK